GERRFGGNDNGSERDECSLTGVAARTVRVWAWSGGPNARHLPFLEPSSRRRPFPLRRWLHPFPALFRGVRDARLGDAQRRRTGRGAGLNCLVAWSSPILQLLVIIRRRIV